MKRKINEDIEDTINWNTAYLLLMLITFIGVIIVGIFNEYQDNEKFKKGLNTFCQDKGFSKHTDYEQKGPTTSKLINRTHPSERTTLTSYRNDYLINLKEYMIECDGTILNNTLICSEDYERCTEFNKWGSCIKIETYTECYEKHLPEDTLTIKALNNEAN